MTRHLKILKSDAQSIITRLKAGSTIDHDYQIQRDGEYVFVPLNSDYKHEPSSEDYAVVDIEPVESKSRPRPRTSSGAFDLIGNIAITKIRNRARAEELAEDLLKSHPVIKSVYLDKGIVGEFRLRDLELLRGEENFNAVYRENGLVFEMDVSKVYFSPRLATERMFVAKDAKDGEFIIDMFAGIGAFSFNIAKQHNVRISAIDSNPDAISHMKRNLEINSLKGMITPLLGKAEDAVPELPKADRIIMNLPHESRQFLKLASSRIKEGGVIHYYEILDVEGLTDRMTEMKSLGLEILKKREVHGYSASMSMYSLTATLLGG